MLVRDRQFRRAPEIADAFRQRCDELLQNCGRSEFNRGAFEQFRKRLRVEIRDHSDRLLDEVLRSFIRLFAARFPRIEQRHTRFAHQSLELRQRRARDLANRVTGDRRFAQEPQAFDIFLGVETAIVLRAHRLDRAVAFLPNPDRMNR